MHLNVILMIVAIIIGFIAGCATMKEAYKHSRIGKLRMDDSTGEPYLFLELSVPVEVALQQKEVVMEVDLTPFTQD